MSAIQSGTPSLQEALRLDTNPVLVFRSDIAIPPPVGETALFYSADDAQWTRVASLAPDGEVSVEPVSVQDAFSWFRQHGQPIPACLEPAWLFVRQGDRWLIQDGHRRGYVKHTKGMSQVARLLDSPRQSITAKKLASGIKGSPGDVRTTDAAKEHREQLGDEPFQVSRPQESSDPGALAAYRTRMQELIETIAEAKAANCKDEVKKCRKEFKDIAKVVKKMKRRGGKNKSKGKGSPLSLEETLEQTFSGKPRNLPESDGSQKARTAVANAVKRALDAVAECPQLGETATFLRTNIELGVKCSYFPDPTIPRWIVEM